jgi:DNA polymerase IV
MAMPTPDPGLWILHVDMDAFLAAVEIRRHPELRGLPVVVGGSGDPTKPRQVVATASYEARAFGVHSGMPLRQAHRKCPDAVFLPSDHPAYDSASAEVMDVLRSFGHPVEVWGWDEAVMGARVDDPEDLARAIRATVVEQTGLTCGVGIGDTKERAKMATNFAKRTDEKIYRLTADNWVEVMGFRPVQDLWGIGAKTAAKLAAHDLLTVSDLAGADHRELAGWFGPTIGPSLKLLAMGGASTTIATADWVRKSRSKQVTFERDLTTHAEIAERVVDLARDVAAEVFGEGRIATHVGVIVRTSTFFTRIKMGKLAEPSTDPEIVVQKALEVLGRFDIDRPVRLLGVKVDLQDLPG